MFLFAGFIICSNTGVSIFLYGGNPCTGSCISMLWTYKGPCRLEVAWCKVGVLDTLFLGPGSSRPLSPVFLSLLSARLPQLCRNVGFFMSILYVQLVFTFLVPFEFPSVMSMDQVRMPLLMLSPLPALPCSLAFFLLGFCWSHCWYAWLVWEFRKSEIRPVCGGRSGCWARRYFLADR